MAALIVSLSGCANTDHPQTIQDSSCIEAVESEAYERTEPEDHSSASVSESKEGAADSTAAVKAETESAQTEKFAVCRRTKPRTGDATAADGRSKQYQNEERKKVNSSTQPKNPPPPQHPPPPPCEKRGRGSAGQPPRPPKNLRFPF